MSTNEKKKILITGINGYVGTWLSNFLSKDFEIIGISRAIPTKKNPEIEYHQVKSYADLDLSRFKKIDVVIHLAARVHIFSHEKNDKELFFKDNPEITKIVAEKAAASGVSRFIFLSTAGVHGYKTESNVVLNESSPVECHNHYTESKLYAEKELYKVSENSKMDYCILRAPLIYGWGAPGNFQRLEMLGKSKNSFIPDIQNKKNFIGILNLSSLLRAVIDREDPICDTFLAADPFTVSTTDLLCGIGMQIGAKKIAVRIPKIIFKMLFSTLGKSKMYEQLFCDFQLSSSKAEKKFGWKAPYSMHQNLEKTKSY